MNISSRVGKLNQIIEKVEAEAFFITNPVNARYMSGFMGGEATLLIGGGKRLLITDFRYLEQARAETQGLYEIIKLDMPLYKLLKNTLSTCNISRLAVEESHITHKDYLELSAVLGSDISLFDQKEQVEFLRQVKDEDELRCIKKAAEIGDEALKNIFQTIKPGMSENEVRNQLEYRMKQLGAEDVSFETIVASGVRSAMPHGKASAKIIEDGDIVTIDFGCVYNGYCSDMTRTFFMGSASDELLKIYNIVNEAQARAISAARAGMTGVQLDSVARNYIRDNGYGDYFGHGLGHGVGLMIHEEPNANTRNDRPLPAGAVITIEPGIYIEGVGGVRIEDMVLITQTGCELLTTTSREVLIL